MHKTGVRKQGEDSLSFTVSLEAVESGHVWRNWWGVESAVNCKLLQCKTQEEDSDTAGDKKADIKILRGYWQWDNNCSKLRKALQ